MLGALLDIFFPPICPLCESDLADGSFCHACASDFESLRIRSPLCTVCGTPFTSGAGADHACAGCITSPPPYKSAASAYYYEGRVLDAVHLLKYSGRVTLADTLGELACRSIATHLRPDLVVPVPLHGSRLRQRGYNQSLLLARKVASAAGAKVDYSNLRRVRMTAPQVGLKAEERRENVRGAFALDEPEAYAGKMVLLVDDVYTTGSTVAECSRVLAKAGAGTFVLTLARAVRK